MRTVVAQQQEIPEPWLAPLRDSASLRNDDAGLRQRLQHDGYVHIREFFDRDDVLAARQAIFNQLASVGEIEQPPGEGIFTGVSQRRELMPELGEFWRSVSESWALRRLSHGPQLHRLMTALLGGAAQAQDFIFLRPAGPGKSTHIHCDAPFFTRMTEAVATAWIALGDIPVELGPLFLLENSHRLEDIVASYRGFDVARDTSRQAARPETPLEFARQHRTRVLTTDFKAGDIVVFQMYLLHGALDNRSDTRRVRLSCDVRYQLASEALDPRYFGADPSGTTGAGYGELVGAKPMTDEWHVR